MSGWRVAGVRPCQERTGCPCSIGSGPNRLVARIATKHAKPDGHFDISQTEAQTHIASLPAADLPVRLAPTPLW